MELDKRIKSLSDILTCFDIEKAKQYVDQKGYFAGKLYCFRDIQHCDYGTLSDVCDDQAEAFHMKEYDIHYSYFIPERFLKPTEKKYRPLTLDEVNDMCKKCMQEISELRDELHSIKYQLNKHELTEHNSANCCASISYPNGFNPQSNWCENTFEYK